MTSFFLFIQRRFIVGFILILMAVAGLLGCEISTATPVICTPNSPNVNIYRATPQALTNLIFQFAVTPLAPSVTAMPVMPTSAVITTTMPGINPPSMPPNEQQIQSSRYAAFQYLIDETKRWSDTQTIKLDDSSEAQIVVTFISPELLQAVFLSEVLKQRVFFPDFEVKTQAMLDTVGLRDELMFLVTINTTTTNSGANFPSHTIDIPIQQMVLINGEGLQIVPKHDDHNLDQPIITSSESVFGYLAYPLAMRTSSECKWVLEPKYNTNIVITVPLIQVDGIGKGPYTWTIPYSSLIDANILPVMPKFFVPPGFDQNLISTLPMPPNGIITQTNNWQDFARFVWNQITLGNY